MPKFSVTVTHEYTKTQTFEIQAETREEAEQKAEHHSDIDWSDPEHLGYSARAWPAEE